MNTCKILLLILDRAKNQFLLLVLGLEHFLENLILN